MTPTTPPTHATASVGHTTNPTFLVVQAGSARWRVPMADVLCIAESTAAPGPVPLAPPLVQGVVDIAGQAFVQVDPRAMLGLPLQQNRTGGVLVVIAAGNGGVALCVDAAGYGAAGDEGTAPPLPIDRLIPWVSAPAGPAPTLQPRQESAANGASPPISLLLAACGGTTVALPIGGIGRVGSVTDVQPLHGADMLVRVDDALFVARRLADALPIPITGPVPADGGRCAVITRAEDGHPAAALLVDRILNLELCDAGSIVSVPLPTGGSLCWLNRSNAPPVLVMDIGAPFGWAAPPSFQAASGQREQPGGSCAAGPHGRPAALIVQAADLRVALPLGLVGRVLESGGRVSARRAPDAVPAFDLAVALGRRSRPQAGVFVTLTADGGSPALLSVDRVLALDGTAAAWQAVEPLPPATGTMIDAVCRDGAGWLLRLRRCPPDTPRLGAVRRPLVAARLGWVTATTTP